MFRVLPLIRGPKISSVRSSSSTSSTSGNGNTGSSIFSGTSTHRVSAPSSSSFKGGLMGFLLGVSITGATAYAYLLDEYSHSSHTLLMSIEDLAKSTNKLRQHTRIMDKMEVDLAELGEKSASKDDIEKLRNELLKMIDQVTMDQADMKTQIWDIRNA